jgi:4-hydroxybenzoate polyprenyltransferase
VKALIFAIDREAAPVIARLSAKKVHTDGEMHVFRPRDRSLHVVILISGIGTENARKTTNYALNELGAELLVNAGVSGALADRSERDAVYLVDKVGLEASGQSIDIEGPHWAHLDSRSLVTVLGSRYDLVDMEGHAVANACRDSGVPCVMVKGVTDSACERGSEDIETNIDSVSVAVADAVLQGLKISIGIGALVRLSNFVKVEHTVFSLPLLFTGAWLGAGRAMPGWRVVGLVFLAGLGARTLGMALNRIFDRDIDAQNARTAGRELPSGRMSLLHAYSVAAAGLAAYLVACAGLGRICLYLAPVPLIPLGLYSLLKRFTSLCHFGIGICLGLAPLGAYVAASGGIEFSREILLIALYAFCWISGFDIIYALQDVEFDKKIGLRSLPAALGVRGSEIAAACVHAVGLLAAVGTWFDSGGGVLAAVALALAAASTMAGHLRFISLQARFFPSSAIAGVSGAVIPILGGF